jgi:hypothetical protein
MRKSINKTFAVHRILIGFLAWSASVGKNGPQNLRGIPVGFLVLDLGIESHGVKANVSFIAGNAFFIMR